MNGYDDVRNGIFVQVFLAFLVLLFALRFVQSRSNLTCLSGVIPAGSVFFWMLEPLNQDETWSLVKLPIYVGGLLGQDGLGR
ncbi:hypothetical protein C1H46_005854 [Malus baccata]|uniref:Uncharacterized protein n=1 Tax=Malus baccata TaxID=106549 RepID=A0A540NBY6_MALBA|nr:hypothetical protein C1H46_005854 [Malus baccata]